MDTFPYYLLGVIDKRAVAALRGDASAKQVMQELCESLGIERKGADFSIFGSIQIMERRGNDFGRALYASGEGGQAIQIYQNQKEWEPLYTFLHLACAKAINEFFLKDGLYWPRVLIWKLSERDDVVNLLTEAKVLK